MQKKATLASIALAAIAMLMLAGNASAADVTVDNTTLFKFATHGTYMNFSASITSDGIVVNAENATFENIKLKDGIYTTSILTVSAENADMTVKTLESESIEFNLVASSGTKSLAKISDGGRGKPKRVKSNDIRIAEKDSLIELYASDDGWYYDEGIIHVKTTHASTNIVLIDFSNVPPTPPSNWTDLGMSLADPTPTVTWTKGVDDDGDTVTTYVYVEKTPAPTTVETSTIGTTADLGFTIPLLDDVIHYYRLRSWDGHEYSAYTTADGFMKLSPAVVPHTLIVRVLDDRTNKPIENVKVDLYKSGKVVVTEHTRWDGKAFLDIAAWGIHELRWTKDGYESGAMEIDLTKSTALILKMVPTGAAQQFPPITWIFAALVVGCVFAVLVYGANKKARAGSLLVAFILPVALLAALCYVGVVG